MLRVVRVPATICAIFWPRHASCAARSTIWRSASATVPSSSKLPLRALLTKRFSRMPKPGSNTREISRSASTPPLPKRKKAGRGSLQSAVAMCFRAPCAASMKPCVSRRIISARPMRAVWPGLSRGFRMSLPRLSRCALATRIRPL